MSRLFMDGDTLIEHRQQDVEPILEHAKALRSIGAVGGSNMRLAANIPTSVIEQYCQTSGVAFDDFMGDPAHIRRLLNDPDLSGFRVWQGRV